MTTNPYFPVRGKTYKHHSGRVYLVLSVANLGDMKPGWSPAFVAYEDTESGIEYARPLTEWLESKYELAT